jgi:hypothetical protein
MTSTPAADRIAVSFPAVKDLVIRTKYLDDMLDQQMRADVRQRHAIEADVKFIEATTSLTALWVCCEGRTSMVGCRRT